MSPRLQFAKDLHSFCHEEAYIDNHQNYIFQNTIHTLQFFFINCIHLLINEFVRRCNMGGKSCTGLLFIERRSMRLFLLLWFLFFSIFSSCAIFLGNIFFSPDNSSPFILISSVPFFVGFSFP